MALALDGSAASSTSTVVLTTTEPGIICVVAVTNGDASITAIADDAGNTYQHRADASDGGSNYIMFWYAVSQAGRASNNIVLTFSNAPTFLRVSAFGVSGADRDNVFDDNAILPVENSANPADPLSVSTSAANTFVIGAFRMSSVDAPAAGSGFTGIHSGVAGSFTLTEYQIVAAPQVALSVTIDGAGSGDSNGGIADAIRAAPLAGALLGSGGSRQPQRLHQRRWYSYVEQWLDELEEEEERKAALLRKRRAEAEAAARVEKFRVEQQARTAERARQEALERAAREAAAAAVSKAVREARAVNDAKRAATSDQAQAALARVEARKQQAMALAEEEELRRLRQIARSPHRRFSQRFEAAIKALKQQGWRAKT